MFSFQNIKTNTTNCFRREKIKGIKCKEYQWILEVFYGVFIDKFTIKTWRTDIHTNPTSLSSSSLFHIETMKKKNVTIRGRFIFCNKGDKKTQSRMKMQIQHSFPQRTKRNRRCMNSIPKHEIYVFILFVKSLGDLILNYLLQNVFLNKNLKKNIRAL